MEARWRLPGISAEPVRETLTDGERGPTGADLNMNLLNAKCEEDQSVILKSTRSTGSGSSTSIRTVSWIKPPTPLYHSSRPAILRVKEIQLDEFYPNYY